MKPIYSVVAVGIMIALFFGVIPVVGIAWSWATDPSYHVRPLKQEYLVRIGFPRSRPRAYELKCPGDPVPRTVRIRVKRLGDEGDAYIAEAFPDCEVLSSWSPIRRRYR